MLFRTANNTRASRFDEHLNRLLNKVSRTFWKEYDVVLLDAPAGISLLWENLFEAADLVLVPVIPTTLSHRTYDQLLKFFQRHQYNKKKLSPFFSVVQAGNAIHKATMSEMRSAHKRFFDSSIPHSVEVERMGIKREPVLNFASQHASAKAYRGLCAEVLSRLHAA